METRDATNTCLPNFSLSLHLSPDGEKDPIGMLELLLTQTLPGGPGGGGGLAMGMKWQSPKFFDFVKSN